MYVKKVVKNEKACIAMNYLWNTTKIKIWLRRSGSRGMANTCV